MERIEHKRFEGQFPKVREDVRAQEVFGAHAILQFGDLRAEATETVSLAQLRHRIAFRRVTRHLPDLEAALARGAEGAGRLAAVISDGDWYADIFYHKDAPYYALAAFQRTLISESQFATVQFLWSIFQAHGREEMVFWRFNEGHLCINKAGVNKHLESDAQKAAFRRELNALPQSERVLFIIPDIQKDYTISKEIEAQDLHAFNRTTPGLGQRIVPSMGVMQAFLNALHGDQAVTMTARIGVSTFEEIRENGMTDTRDISIPFPGIDFPKWADNLRVPQLYDFFYHDFYHAFVCSAIPPAHRRDFIVISRELDALHAQLKKGAIDPLALSFVAALAERFVDMEMGLYRPIEVAFLETELNRKVSVEQVYWEQILNQTIAATDRLGAMGKTDHARAVLREVANSGVMLRIARVFSQNRRTVGIDHLPKDSLVAGIVRRGWMKNLTTDWSEVDRNQIDLFEHLNQ